MFSCRDYCKKGSQIVSPEEPRTTSPVNICHSGQSPPDDKIFKWCTCHRYLSSDKEYPEYCFKDCELRTANSDPRKYSTLTLAEYMHQTYGNPEYYNRDNKIIKK
jgi:hypothetical protein